MVKAYAFCVLGDSLVNVVTRCRGGDQRRGKACTLLGECPSAPNYPKRIDLSLGSSGAFELAVAFTRQVNLPAPQTEPFLQTATGVDIYLPVVSE